MSNFTKLHLTHASFRNFTCIITIIVKFVGVITDDLLHLWPMEM